ncbi:MAG: hypothetical protein JO247_06595 [Chloroflexi bacterium]|nr:hypothetical protein [Chloroflexota bacterium]
MALAKQVQDWRFVVPVPARVVFAAMEQAIGTMPYRFEVLGSNEARIIEYRRRGLFGTWSKPRVGIRWVHCVAEPSDAGTRVTISASGSGGLIFKAMGKADRGPTARAVQLVNLLASGRDDPRTIYRARPIPPGPVTLVASWAGTPYRLFAEPSFDAPRGPEVLTATEIEAIAGGNASFVHVRLATGAEGYIERDQVVASPDEATRAAQTAVAGSV